MGKMCLVDDMVEYSGDLTKAADLMNGAGALSLGQLLTHALLFLGDAYGENWKVPIIGAYSNDIHNH